MKIIYTLWILVFLSACSHELPIQDYLQWVENEKNGLVVKRTLNSADIILQYQPLEYVALLNLRQGSITKESVSAEIAGLSGYYYFSFKIKPSVAVDANQDYFNYQLGNNFHLIQGNDTLKCAFFHQESTRNFSPFLTFLLAFKVDQPLIEDLTFQYTDEYFGLNIIKFQIEKASLKNIPSLKFE